MLIWFSFTFFKSGLKRLLVSSEGEGGEQEGGACFVGQRSGRVIRPLNRCEHTQTPTVVSLLPRVCVWPVTCPPAVRAPSPSCGSASSDPALGSAALEDQDERQHGESSQQADPSEPAGDGGRVRLHRTAARAPYPSLG